MKSKLSISENTLSWVILFVTLLISVIASCVFITNQLNIADYDAIARLNIARKTFDSLTPGLGQLGGIWLPFPQVLMIPLVKSDFMWHSGIAGTFVSMLVYVLGAYFLFKTAMLITKSKVASVLAWLVYVTNLSLLLLQTSAMSEPFFIFTIIMVIYFLTKWLETKRVPDLLYAAAFVALTTLTRYEGYIVLIASVMVFVLGAFCLFGLKERKKVEGLLILFLTLSFLGIILWSAYSFAIFNDAIYWLHLYSGQAKVSPTELSSVDTSSTTVLAKKQASRSFYGAFMVYGWAASLIVGIPVIFIGVISILYLYISQIFFLIRKTFDVTVLPLIFISFFVICFLVFGYRFGLIPAIETPPLSIQVIFDKSFNALGNTNIRYGIILLPFVALAIGYLGSKLKIFSVLLFLVVIVQLIAVYYSPYFLTYDLSKRWSYSQIEGASWLKKNYDGGLILISAHRFETLMFQTDLPYSTFIYEGSQKYWQKSLKDPSIYATWVVFNPNVERDYVAEYLQNRENLEEKYEVVFQQNNGLRIYKIKPDFLDDVVKIQ